MYGGDRNPNAMEEEKEIAQEDVWTVISAFFEEKGLVRQQLNSFDEFIRNSLQEIVDASPGTEIRLDPQQVSPACISASFFASMLRD